MRLIVLLSFIFIIPSVHSDGGQLDKSLSDLNILLEQDPKQAIIKVSELNQLFIHPQPSSRLWFELKIIEAKTEIKLGLYQDAKQHLYQLESYLPVMAQFSEAPALIKLLLAQIEQKQSNIESSFTLLEQALGVVPKELVVLRSDILHSLARGLRYKARYREAERVVKDAISLVEPINDKARLGTYYNQLGVIYDYMGSLQLALRFHEKSLKLQRSLKNQQGLSNSLYNIGEIYRDLEKYNKALLHFEQALEVDKSLGDPIHIANSHGKLSQVYLQQGEIELALSHSQSGIELTRSSRSNSDLAWQLSILAKIYVAQDALSQALSVAQEALSLAISAKASRTERTVRLVIIEIELVQGHYAKALVDIEQVLTLPGIGNSYLAKLHQYKAQAQEKLGEFESALHSLQQFIEIKAILYQDLDKQQALTLRQNVEFIRQEQALKLIQNEQALQQASLENLKLQRGMGVSLLLCFMAIAIYIYKRQQQKHKYVELEADMMAQSLTQKNRLLADVSHELRTPLAALKLTVEAMQHNIEPDPKKGFDKIQKKISHLDNLIKDIYQSAQFDNDVLTLDKQPVDVNVLIGEIVEEFQPMYATKQQSLSFEACTNNSLCFVDPARIRQVLFNLLRNSHFYTSNEGQTHVNFESNEEHMKVTVEDSFPGVAEQDLEKIFERLYRCEGSRSRDHGGSGLGLAICKQIIRAHGGNVGASHSEMGGVSITLYIPFEETRSDS
ncbi:tetratricopeptide repeat protein [Pseudoalteromonas luteoviolacea]|uniref:tetratricopeptide repeat protein n=1 Tax=Pseudoalteromonas luteoviolacea TaxID=43657 RepID=UPI0012DA39E4|nr:tetratricopeptide repeat protein [Pseudoalteromonas luteoviolacea]